MAVLINFKICDNAKECGGIAVCPTGALSYDDEKETIVIDNEKCISCGMCEKECPIGAIVVAKTEEEYKKKKEEIDNDPRTTKDLFVDRYGAAPLSEFFMIDVVDLKDKLSDGITLVECYNDDSIECLLKSIPIKELTAKFAKDTLFYKMNVDGEFMREYNISKLPAMLIYKNKDYRGKVEGYYSFQEQEKLLNEIKLIID